MIGSAAMIETARSVLSRMTKREASGSGKIVDLETTGDDVNMKTT